MTIVELASLFLSVCVFIIGATIYLRNKQLFVNKVFVVFAFVCSLWGISYANIELFDNLNIVKIINSFTFAISILVVYCAAFFTYVFPVRKKATTFIFMIPLLLLVIGLCFTPLISGEVKRNLGNPPSYIYEAGSLSVVYILTMLYGVLLIAKNLFIGTNAYSRQQKAQAKIIATGFVSSAVIGILIANVLPSTLGIQEIDLFAPFSLILLVGFTGYAIVRHKLFDIRLIVARALGYALTLLTVAGFYSLFIFVFLAGLLGGDKISVAQRSVYSILAVLFGFSLPPLKKFFDKLTNALFYKDAYDAQIFLDTFNKTLVGNIDLQPLLRNAAELIEETLKAEYCLFGIRETENTPRRIIGTKSINFTEADIAETMAHTPSIHQKVIVVDELGESHSKLKETLSRNNVAILARLISSVSQKQGQGYLILGQKKSGNPYNKQDIQVLEIVVNELVIAIQNAMRFEEIQAFTVTLQEKVNEATKQLRQTNEKLKALDETKDEFISMASHQLRTPLTSVKGYISMVIEGDVGKLTKQQHELLAQAFASSQRMVYLIADLLNVSRLRTGKFVIENKPTQLSDVIETEISQLQEAAAGKKQTLTYKKPKGFPQLMMDETKIRQVIMNFTDNALYYTPAGGKIDLTLEDKGKSIEFTVVDNGIGVPKAEQHHMFSKFYRAGNAKKARPDGTGLGLFMAKKVIIAQGGAVIFHSEENKGSTFGFSFPKDKLKMSAKAAAAASSDPEPVKL